MATALAALMSMPIVPLAPEPTPVQPLTRLAAELGSGCPRLFIKRDDLLSFGLGGNKVRKIQAVAAEARAALGFHVVLVLNVTDGRMPSLLTGNARPDQIFCAEVRYVDSLEARQPAMGDTANA